MLMGHMAMDIERGIKSTAGTPVKQGMMKASARHFRDDRGRFRVEVDKEYAAVQEAGERDGVRFSNYTTPGTSAGWFQRAINNVWQNRDSYVSEVRRALSL
jgi:hypothetical protein